MINSSYLTTLPKVWAQSCGIDKSRTIEMSLTKDNDLLLRPVKEQKKTPPRSCEFYEGLAQIYKDAKAMERTLTSAENREMAFAELVGRLERFTTQDGVWETTD